LRGAERRSNLDPHPHSGAAFSFGSSNKIGTFGASMKETIDQVRRLLDDLESQMPSENDEAFARSFSGSEIPELLQDIADFLVPQLMPTAACFYLYMFRHSVIATGRQHLRVSSNKMQTGVVRSSYSESRSGGKIDAGFSQRP
jgi:hypothetical protein